MQDMDHGAALMAEKDGCGPLLRRIISRPVPGAVDDGALTTQNNSFTSNFDDLVN